MYEINRTDAFEAWLSTIRDPLTRGRLLTRLRRVSLGNLGDVAPISEGISEMREHFGAGWRMYYIQHGDVVIVMLGGGDKSTQQQDIDRAIKLSKTLED